MNKACLLVYANNNNGLVFPCSLKIVGHVPLFHNSYLFAIFTCFLKLRANLRGCAPKKLQLFPGSLTINYVPLALQPNNWESPNMHTEIWARLFKASLA